MSTIGYAILADLGNLNVFAINQSEHKSISLKHHESLENFESEAKASEIYTDRHGDVVNPANDQRNSYESKSDLEIKHRSIDSISKFINDFAAQHSDKLYLAISDPIHANIQEKLSDTTQSKVAKLLPKNLNQQSNDSIIKAFGL